MGDADEQTTLLQQNERSVEQLFAGLFDGLAHRSLRVLEIGNLSIVAYVEWVAHTQRVPETTLLEERPLKRTRVMATLAVIALVMEMSVMAAPAGATGRASTANIDAPWADASFSVTRNGWVVTVRGHVKDTRADGTCTYVKASLYVDSWADPNKESAKNCHSAASGYSMPYAFTLRSGGGAASTRSGSTSVPTTSRPTAARAARSR